MRGKKIDTEFVSGFIADCAARKKINPEDICKEAERRIQEIDNKIIEVEELKKVRSKLKDVMITLDKKTVDKTEGKKILSFYSISNLKQAYNLCVDVKEQERMDMSEVLPNEKFLLKELQVVGLIKSDVGCWVPGNNLEEFLVFYKANYS